MPINTETIYIDCASIPATIQVRIGDYDTNYYPYPKNTLSLTWTLEGYGSGPDQVYGQTLQANWGDGGKLVIPVTKYEDFLLDGTPCASYADLITYVTGNFFAVGSGGGGGGDATAANQVTQINNQDTQIILESSMDGRLGNIETGINTSNGYLVGINSNTTGILSDTGTISSNTTTANTYLSNISTKSTSMDSNISSILGWIVQIKGGLIGTPAKYEWSTGGGSTGPTAGQMIIAAINKSTGAMLSLSDLNALPGGTNDTLFKDDEKMVLLNGNQATNFINYTNCVSKLNRSSSFTSGNAPVGITVVLYAVAAH